MTSKISLALWVTKFVEQFPISSTLRCSSRHSFSYIKLVNVPVVISLIKLFKERTKGQLNMGLLQSVRSGERKKCLVKAATTSVRR